MKKRISVGRLFLLTILLLQLISCSKNENDYRVPDQIDGSDFIEDYDALSVTDGISDWTEAIFTKDGNIFCRKDNASNHLPERVLISLDKDDSSVEMYLLSFYGDGTLKTLETSDFLLKFINYQEDSFDVVVFFPNGVSCFYEELKFLDNIPSTRGWKDDNWVRKTSKVLNVIVNAVGIGMGLVAIAASSEVLIGAVGVASIVTAGTSLANSLSAFDDTVVGSAAVGNVTTLESLLTSYEKFGGKKYSASLALISGGITVVDDLWGHTLTYEERQNEIIKLLTSGLKAGNSTEVGTTSAKCTALLENFSSSQEVGICYSHQHSVPYINNGQAKKGSMQAIGNKTVVTSELSNLKQGMTYYYRPFITSIDRSLIAYGPIKNFTTKKCITGNYFINSKTECTCTGEVSWPENDEEIKNISYGICYSDIHISPNCFSDQVVYSEGKTFGAFNVILTDLEEDKRYHYRCFLKVDEIYYYGDTYSFTISKNESKIVGVWSLYNYPPLTEEMEEYPWFTLCFNSNSYFELELGPLLLWGYYDFYEQTNVLKLHYTGGSYDGEKMPIYDSEGHLVEASPAGTTSIWNISTFDDNIFTVPLGPLGLVTYIKQDGTNSSKILAL